VHVESWVDQNDVLREAALVVCHGGSGTTFGALRAGVPLVVVPLFADQRANGVKVAESRCGRVLDLDQERAPGRPPLDREDAPAVADAIRSVLADSSYGEGAQQVSREMAAAPPCDELLRALLPDSNAP
jgi:UDP:flavonoid glycosyltransferase YjiC (YdhE family)